MDDDRVVVGISSVLYGTLNLDFFRDIYPPFCLSSHYNVMSIIALDYIVALYPFFLILITYVLIRMHDSNCFLVVLLWKPFKFLLKRFYKHFDNRTSLVETFANFILLSSVKILSVSLFLLIPANTYDEFGNRYSTRYLNLDSTIEWFGKAHLPYGALAIVTGFIFVIFPTLLLLLYPCQCFQRFLNYFGLNSQVLRVFMDAFQGSYRLEPYDMRYWSACNLILRFLILTVEISLGSIASLCSATFFVVLNATLASVIDPYRNSSHKKINSLAMSMLAIFYVSLLTMMTTFYLDVHWVIIPNFFSVGSQVMLLLFIVFVVFGSLFKHKMKVLCCRMKYKVLSSMEWRKNWGDSRSDQLESFSERSPLNT